MESLLQDVRYAARMLRKSCGFAIIVVLTLALGIGANTAVFSVVNAVLLRPLPFQQPQQLVAIKDDITGLNMSDVGISQPELQDLQDRSGVFDQVSAAWATNTNVTGREKPERVETQIISVNYFTLLGAKSELGRVIEPSDYQPGFYEGAVISDGLWRRMFGADPAVIGQAVRLDSDLYHIVGVMPPDFRHPGPTINRGVEVWIAGGLVAAPFPQPPVRSLRMVRGAIGRLKSGLTLEQAQSKLDAFVAHLREEYPTEYPTIARWTIRLVPLKDDVVGKTGTMLIVLLAAVSLVLLIACVNIASLTLARSSARYREIAIRRALGAGRVRLIRQTLTESTILALAGGFVAILLSFWLTPLLLRMAPSSLPRAAEVSINGSTILFVLALSILTGLFFGVIPALQLSDPSLMENLRQGSRSGGLGRQQHRVLSSLVVSELALSLVLMVGAGLLLRSFWNLLEVEPGFNPSYVLTAHIWLPFPNDTRLDHYREQTKRSIFVREVVSRVSTLPGVEQAAIGAGSTAFSGLLNRLQFTIEGQSVGQGEMPTAQLGEASSDFLSTLKMPLVRGRFFTDADNETGAQVAVIDQTAADLYWHNADPINKQIQLATLGQTLLTTKPPLVTIVGVVGKTKSDGLDAPYSPHIFIPALQFVGYGMTVYVRTTAAPDGLEAQIRREVHAIDPDIPVFGVETMDGIVSDSLASRKFAMQILAIFASTALLLAALGIYGVMAYFVSQRVREIGIRVAVGAQPSDIRRLIVGRGTILTFAGLVIGIFGALALVRSLTSLIFGVAPFDPLVFTAAAMSLAAIGLAASYIPARRAARVDPMVALRSE
jgi:predicted permease